MPYPLIAAGVAAGANALTAWLNNRKKARTREFDNYSTNYSTTTRTRTLRPEQEAGMSLLDRRMHVLLNDPEAGLAPLRAGRRNQVNQRYAGMPQMLADRMLSHGQKSGKFGRATREMEMARFGEMADVDNWFAQLILEQKDKGVGIAERLLGQDFGGTVSTRGSSRSWGTGVAPGSATGSAVSGGTEALTTLMMIDKMMQGPGGSTGGQGFTDPGWGGG